MTLRDPPFSWLFEPSPWQLGLPVALSLAGLGIALARGRKRSPTETLANVATYAAVIAVDFFFANAVMIFAFSWLGHAIPWKLPVNLATFALAFVVVDFCHYWRHRISHKVHLLWCVHGVHHSSEELNFSTVLRLSLVEPIYNWAFFAPALLLGFPGGLVIAAIIVNFQYQLYFVHNGDVGKLPVLDLVLGTPSNHRVHHAVNPEYLDRNFGGVLIIWDHLFGTYAPEVAEPRFGIVKPIGTRNPWLITFRPFARLREAFAGQKTFRGKWRALFGHPGSLETS